MAEKKCTKKAASTTKTKKTAEKKTTEKIVAVKPLFAIDAVNVGFRAGDVYEALAQAKTALSIEDLAKEAKISESEVLLGMGWLLKEGKIKEDKGLVTLA